MLIFRIRNDILKPIIELELGKKNDIKDLVQKNLKIIFGVNFVASDLELRGAKIDILGFDREEHVFVILKFINDKNISVSDQYSIYHSLILYHKEELLLTLNENNKTEFLNNENVNWDMSRIIFVSPSFDMNHRKGLEFRYRPIELWEVKLYLNNIIIFNKIIVQETSRSENTIKKTSKLIKDTNGYAIVDIEEDHIKDKPDWILALYRELRTNILSIGDDVILKPRIKYIAFKRKTNFVDIVLRKSYILLFLNLKWGLLNDIQNIARDVSKLGHHGNGDYEIKLKKIEEIDYVVSLLKQAYEKN